MGGVVFKHSTGRNTLTESCSRVKGSEGHPGAYT